MCQDRILDFLRTWLFSFSRLRQRHQELFTYPFLSVSRFLFSKTMYIVLVILSRQYKRLNSENMMKCIFSESTWYLTESLVDILTDSLFTNAESHPGFGPVRFLNWCWPSRLYTPTTTFESLFASIELIFPYVEVLRELRIFFSADATRIRRVQFRARVLLVYKSLQYCIDADSSMELVVRNFSFYTLTFLTDLGILYLKVIVQMHIFWSHVSRDRWMEIFFRNHDIYVTYHICAYLHARSLEVKIFSPPTSVRRMSLILTLDFNVSTHTNCSRVEAPRSQRWEYAWRTRTSKILRFKMFRVGRIIIFDESNDQILQLSKWLQWTAYRRRWRPSVMFVHTAKVSFEF